MGGGRRSLKARGGGASWGAEPEPGESLKKKEKQASEANVAGLRRNQATLARRYVETAIVMSVLEDVRKVGDKHVPHTVTMTNLEDRTDTVNVLDRIQLGVEIPESVFESRNLGR